MFRRIGRWRRLEDGNAKHGRRICNSEWDYGGQRNAIFRQGVDSNTMDFSDSNCHGDRWNHFDLPRGVHRFPNGQDRAKEEET